MSPFLVLIRNSCGPVWVRQYSGPLVPACRICSLSAGATIFTDPHGVQCISNIPRPGHERDRDIRAYGRDWSNRPWFIAATREKGLVVSDVYESVATGNPCVTVSSVIMQGTRMVGVVAVDVVLGETLR
ncbi:PDC sensor domain-containing protein [Desulfoplanes sp.]